MFHSASDTSEPLTTLNSDSPSDRCTPDEAHEPATSLAKARKEAGISITDAAAQAGLTTQTLAAIENGTVPPSAETLMALGNAYQTDGRLLLLDLIRESMGR